MGWPCAARAPVQLSRDCCCCCCCCCCCYCYRCCCCCFASSPFVNVAADPVFGAVPATPTTTTATTQQHLDCPWLEIRSHLLTLPPLFLAFLFCSSPAVLLPLHSSPPPAFTRFFSFVRSFRCTDRGFSGIRWEIGQLTGRSDTSIGSVSVDLFFLPRIFGRSRRVPSFRHRSRFFDRCWFLFFVRPFYRFFLPSFTGDETRCDGWNGTRPDRVALEPRLTCLLGFTGFY